LGRQIFFEDLSSGAMQTNLETCLLALCRTVFCALKTCLLTSCSPMSFGLRRSTDSSFDSLLTCLLTFCRPVFKCSAVLSSFALQTCFWCSVDLPSVELQTCFLTLYIHVTWHPIDLSTWLWRCSSSQDLYFGALQTCLLASCRPVF
jgi:hypothetical protein